MYDEQCYSVALARSGRTGLSKGFVGRGQIGDTRSFCPPHRKRRLHCPRRTIACPARIRIEGLQPLPRFDTGVAEPQSQDMVGPVQPDPHVAEYWARSFEAWHPPGADLSQL